jgi:hypothetical protein
MNASVVSKGNVVVDVDKDLRGMVRACATRLAAATLLAGASLSSDIKDVLTLTCILEPIPRSLKTVYAHLGVDRRAIWKHLHENGASRRIRPLRYWQEGIAVIRCASGKTRHNTWTRVASQDGFSVDWFREALIRQTGFQPRDLDDDNLEYLQLCWLPKHLRSIMRECGTRRPHSRNVEVHSTGRSCDKRGIYVATATTESCFK